VSVECYLYILPLQRDRKERKHYTDDWALGDEEIEGRRSFRLEDKMESDRFPQCFVKEMVGSGMLILESFFVVIIGNTFSELCNLKTFIYMCMHLIYQLVDFSFSYRFLSFARYNVSFLTLLYQISIFYFEIYEYKISET
jgi:hypothetical protein